MNPASLFRRIGLWAVALTALAAAGALPAHAQTLTVAQARAVGVTSPNTTVTVQGIVTSVTAGSGVVYITDPDGGAGLEVFKSGLQTTQAIGNMLTATGPLKFFHGEIELAATAVTTDSTGNTVPPPAVLTIPQSITIGPAPTYAHPNEGRLLTWNSVTVTSASSTSNPANATYNVVDSKGNKMVVFVNTLATTTSNNPITATTLQVGNIYNITGILAYFGPTTTDASNTPQSDPTKFELKPRNASDVTFLGQALIQSAYATPTVVSPGGNVTLNVSLAQPTGSTVTANLTPLGGSATAAFTDNGGGSFTLNVPVSASQAVGEYTIDIAAANGTNTGASSISFTVANPNQTVNIAQARAVPDYTIVTTSGVLTASGTTGTGQMYIQDTSGQGGKPIGVALFDSQGRSTSIGVGELVTVQGVKKTFNGGVEIDYSDFFQAGVNPTSAPATPASPTTMTEAQWPQYPGVLATTNSLYIVSGSGTSNANYWATDGTSFGLVFLSSRAGFTTATAPAVGSSYNVSGIVDYFNNGSATSGWEIKPTGASDIVAGSAPAVIPTQLSVSAEPVGGQPGQPLATQPVISVKDASGNTVSGFNGPVTVVIKPGTGASGAVLSGTTTVNAMNGVATFSGLSVDKAGTGYVLTATTGPLSIDTAAFTVGTPAVPGDINKDGVLDAKDAVMALQVAGGLLSSADASVSFAAGNVAPKGTPDSAIDIQDAVRIIRAVNSLDTLP